MDRPEMKSGPAERFVVEVPDSELEDLFERLARTRWPDDLENEDWRYGANTAYLKELVAYWLDGYDWRQHEVAINAHPNFKAMVNGTPIHFIHERGKGPDPIPLILSHGWPWTFWEFKDVIGPLTDPVSYGGDAEDSFDVVVPSLPGFAFSTPLSHTGITATGTADYWVTLMRDVLGYDRFAAQGGDAGHLVSSQLGHRYPQHLLGVHLSMAIPMSFFTEALPGEEAYAEGEKHLYHETIERMAHATTHVAVQSSEPQTIGHALNDSPVGLLAWLVERRYWWPDNDGDIESVYSKDDLITTTMLYWITQSVTSAARLYWESAHDPWTPDDDQMPVVKAPTGIAIFPKELAIMPKSFLESYYALEHLSYQERGGHFAPSEQPEALVSDVREFFRPLRGR